MEGSTKRRCPNINKIRGLGYNPKVSLSNGLKNTIDWYTSKSVSKKNNDLL